jgi:hypothetical protein
VLGLWHEADRGETPLVMPAAAMAEANHLIGAGHNAWSALLYPMDVNVVPLDSSQAIDTGHQTGSLVVRHVVHEARAVGGIIVTRAPWQYPPDSGPIRAV